MSRSPKTVIATVRGIGVAVITSTCGGVCGLGPQRVALLDAEPVLLVDHHQPEVGELDAFVEQGVRTHHDPGLAGGESGSAARRAAAASEPVTQRDAGAVRVAVELAGAASGPSRSRQAAQMLHGEHLGRRQQRRLSAGVDHLQHRPQRAHRLARADLALQQPVHRVRRAPGRPRSPRRPRAARRSARTAAGASNVASSPSLRAWSRGAGESAARPLAALHKRQLYGERLVPLEPLAGGAERLAAVRAVDLAQRVPQATQPALGADAHRQRVVRQAEVSSAPGPACRCSSCSAPWWPGRSGSARRRIPRSRPRPRPCRGRQHLELRRVQLAVAAEVGDLAGEQAPPAFDHSRVA